MKPNRALYITIATILIIAFGAIAYLFLVRSNPQPTETRTNTTQTNTQNSNENEADEEEPVSIPVKVYFSKHPESDDDPARTFPVDRIATDRATGRYVVEQLIAGPTTEEQAVGYFSMVRVRDGNSNCGDRDFTLAIENRVATLKFCRTFDALGTVADGQAQSAITDSLLQFETIDKVIILNPEGHCQFDMSGEDRCLQ